VGLRPYSPAHLTARGNGGGDLDLRWIRRTRIDGDNWSGVEVPLGETVEAYLVRVVQGALVRREVTVGQPFWTYPAGMQVADAVALPFEIHVAQMSDSFGPGPFRRIMIDV
jgi:hypothetical protein